MKTTESAQETVTWELPKKKKGLEGGIMRKRGTEGKENKQERGKEWKQKGQGREERMPRCQSQPWLRSPASCLAGSERQRRGPRHLDHTPAPGSTLTLSCFPSTESELRDEWALCPLFPFSLQLKRGKKKDERTQELRITESFRDSGKTGMSDNRLIIIRHLTTPWQFWGKTTFYSENYVQPNYQSTINVSGFKNWGKCSNTAS